LLERLARQQRKRRIIIDDQYTPSRVALERLHCCSIIAAVMATRDRRDGSARKRSAAAGATRRDRRPSIRKGEMLLRPPG
jgi:hypothetical protein